MPLPTCPDPRAPCRLPASLAGLLLLSALLAAMPAAAQYKWKDERGQLHVSDLPPPAGVPERQILQRPAVVRRAPAAAPAASTPATAAAAQPSAASAPVDPELAKRRLLAEQAARAQAQADEQRQAAQRAENCQRARQQLALYQSGQRLIRVNAAGERIVVDDSTRDAELQRARRIADSDCR